MIISLQFLSILTIKTSFSNSKYIISHKTTISFFFLIFKSHIADNDRQDELYSLGLRVNNIQQRKILDIQNIHKLFNAIKMIKELNCICMRFMVNFTKPLEIYRCQIFLLLVKTSCSALKGGIKPKEEECQYSGEDFSDKNGIRTVKGLVVMDVKVDFTKEFNDFLFFESLEIVAHFELLRNRILILRENNFFCF